MVWDWRRKFQRKVSGNGQAEKASAARPGRPAETSLAARSGREERAKLTARAWMRRSAGSGGGHGAERKLLIS
jgi:predicted phage gp36 major capsid-like protein